MRLKSPAFKERPKPYMMMARAKGKRTLEMIPESMRVSIGDDLIMGI